jgi:hypothetical protein
MNMDMLDDDLLLQRLDLPRLRLGAERLSDER